MSNYQTMSFTSALREQIVARKLDKKPRYRRLLELIDSKPSKRRDRVLNRLEQHATVHLKDEGLVGSAEVDGLIDWKNIDWAKVFDNLISFIIKILPIILALFGM